MIKRTLLVTCVLVLLASGARAEGSSWGQAAPPGARLRVVDGNGNDVGTFLTLDRLSGSVLVYHDLLDFHLWLDRANGRIITENASVQYEQANCEGQPWFTAAYVGRMQGPFPTGEYVVVAAEAVAGLTFESRRQIFSSTCSNGPQTPPGFYSRMLEITLEDVGLDFPVPLPLNVRPNHRVHR